MKQFVLVFCLFLIGCNSDKQDVYWRDYQIDLFRDSVYVYDKHRLVTTLHYSEIGKLDSCFMEDNQ